MNYSPKAIQFMYIVHTYNYACVYVCVCVCMSHTHTHARTHARMHAHTHAHTHTHTHTYRFPRQKQFQETRSMPGLISNYEQLNALTCLQIFTSTLEILCLIGLGK